MGRPTSIDLEQKNRIAPHVRNALCCVAGTYNTSLAWLSAASKIQKTVRSWLSRRGDSLYMELMLTSGGDAGYRSYHSTGVWLFSALRDNIAHYEDIDNLHVIEFQERGVPHAHIYYLFKYILKGQESLAEFKSRFNFDADRELARLRPWQTRDLRGVM